MGFMQEVKSSQSYLYSISQYHKSQFASKGFTICSAQDTLGPQTLETDKEHFVFFP